MIYSNEIDGDFSIYSWTYFSLCFVLGMITLILHNSTAFVLITIGLFAINIFLIYLLLSKKYKVTKNSIKLIIGPFETIIKMKDIKKSYITNRKGFSYSTSKRCLCIETNDKIYYISPKKKDELLMHIIKNKGD